MNGDYTAGGMWMAPEAEADDGLLDVVLIGDVTKLDFVAHVPEDLPRHATSATRRSSILAGRDRDGSSRATPLPIALDGEQPGTTPVTFEVVPHALRLRVPPALSGGAAGELPRALSPALAGEAAWSAFFVGRGGLLRPRRGHGVFFVSARFAVGLTPAPASSFARRFSRLSSRFWRSRTLLPGEADLRAPARGDVEPCPSRSWPVRARPSRARSGRAPP